jgi:hypothetical protein
MAAIKKEGKINTLELFFSELLGKESHPDMQKIYIIGFFFENSLH